MAKRHDREWRNGEILDALETHTQVDVAAMFGVSQSLVADVARRNGCAPRRRLFTPEEDRQVLATEDIAGLARKLGRAYGSVYLRRQRLLGA